jgi:hypothetical protein
VNEEQNFMPNRCRLPYPQTHTHKKNQQKKTKIQHNAKIKTEIKPKGKMSLAEGCHPLWESERAAWLREF